MASRRFFLAPLKYKTNPNANTAIVVPTTLIRNSCRFDESPGGRTETMIDSNVTENARLQAIQTPALPPGTRTA